MTTIIIIVSKCVYLKTYIQGPGGRFSPEDDSFMDCREKDRCGPFQQDPLPCNKQHQFRCLFAHEYGDGLDVKGNVITADVSLTPDRGAHSLAKLALGYISIYFSLFHSIKSTFLFK